MRSIILVLVLVGICFWGARDAHSCKRIPEDVEINKQYRVYIKPVSDFKIQILKIDNKNCWITGELIKNNKKIFIDMNEIRVISEDVGKR